MLARFPWMHTLKHVLEHVSVVFLKVHILCTSWESLQMCLCLYDDKDTCNVITMRDEWLQAWSCHSLGMLICKDTMEQRRSLVVNNALSSEYNMDVLVNLYHAQNVVSVPICHESKPVGALCVVALTQAPPVVRTDHLRSPLCTLLSLASIDNSNCPAL